MSTEIKCARFAPGAAVPEWLLAAEPMGPDSVAGPFIFQIEVDVLELEDRFVLLPTGTGSLAPTLHYGGQGARLYAPAKPVCNVLVTNTIMGLEVDAWSEVPVAPPTWLAPAEQDRHTEMAQAYLTREGEAFRQAMEQRAMRQLRPGFWRRLWDAIANA